MPNAHVHPPDAVLHSFLLGKLSDLEEAEVESHFANCPECQARAATACPSDTLVELLASAGANRGNDPALLASTLTGMATPSLAASTKVWDGPRPPPLAGVPAVLTGHTKYRALRQLGAGGMGTVWLAEHTVMNRTVAVKVIRPDRLAHPGAAARFLREGQAAAKLHHPNIVTAYDAETVGDSCLLVMEYVEGETLSDRLKVGPLPIIEACRAVRDAAHGLAHAHAAGLTHRDVKPGNLIRAADGITKVLDFGLVGFGEADGSGLTGENVVMGTPDYIAPEQAGDARTADARSDVYALGCALYHLLAGRVPFPAESAVRKIDAHRTREPDPVPGIPDSLAAILRRMMAKRPDDRYQTAEAVAAALEPFCDETAAPQPVPPRRRGRRWAVVAGLLLGLATVGVAGAVYKIQRDNEVITITTDDADIEVVMKRNGELVRIVDTKTKQAWELDTQKMRLKPDGGELSIDLPGKEPLTIRRNGDVAVSVHREPKRDAAKPIPPVAADPDLVRTFTGHTGTVRCVAYSPDGKYLLSGSGWPQPDGTVRLWEVAAGKEVWTATFGVGINAVAFGPKDRVLVGSWDGSVRMLDMKTGDIVRTMDRGDGLGLVYSVAVSSDGRRVLASANYFARVWDIETGKIIQTFRKHTGEIMVVSAAFSPSGERAATGGTDGTVRVWEVETGKELKVFKGTPNQIGHGLAFTPDGKHLLFGHETELLLWNWETDQVTRRFKGLRGPGGVVSVAISADGKRCLSGGSDQVLRLWDVESGKLVRTYTGHTNAIWGVAFSPDGHLALTGSGGTFTPHPPAKDWTLRLWRLPEPNKP